MRRLFFRASKNTKTNASKSVDGFLQRSTALFLFVVMLMSTIFVLPPVQTWAAERNAGKLPGPLKESEVTHAPASDISTKVNGIAQSTPSYTPSNAVTVKSGEITSKRTANSSVTRNSDGTLTKRTYSSARYYQQGSSWKEIDSSLIEDKNAGDSGQAAGKAFGQVQSWFSGTDAYMVKENDWQARFAGSDFERGMVRIKKGSQQIAFRPINAKKGVSPVITTQDGKQVVNYYDLWPGVNVEYIVYGAGAQTGRKTESIYDDTGKVVAGRTNNDPWTCTTYDSRERATQTIVPTINGRTGRTITTTYNYQNSPFKTKVDDSVAGSSETEIDLLGRSINSKDVFGTNYSTAYDSLGRVASKTTPIGTETPTYDSLSRVTSYKIDNTTYATITYDQYSRVSGIEYPQAKDSNDNKLKLESYTRDALQRIVGTTYRFANGSAYTTAIDPSVTGLVTSNTETLGSQSVTNTYTYDKGGRLTEAKIDTMKYQYGYGAPNSGTCSQPGANLNAHKNSNRTSFTATSLATSQVTGSATYCYNQADQLIASSDVQVGAPTYDDHGNTVSLAATVQPLPLATTPPTPTRLLPKGKVKSYM